MKRGASRGDATIIVLYWYLQCLVAIGLFTKNKQIKKMSSTWGVFFEKRVDTTVSPMLIDFGFHFGEVLDAKIGTNRFRRGFKKRSNKKLCG